MGHLKLAACLDGWRFAAEVDGSVVPPFWSSPGTALILLSISDLREPPHPGFASPPTRAGLPRPLEGSAHRPDSILCKMLMFHLYSDSAASTFWLLTNRQQCQRAEDHFSESQHSHLSRGERCQ